MNAETRLHGALYLVMTPSVIQDRQSAGILLFLVWPSYI